MNAVILLSGLEFPLAEVTPIKPKSWVVNADSPVLRRIVSDNSYYAIHESATFYPRIKIGNCCAISTGTLASRDISDFSAAVSGAAPIINISKKGDIK